MKNNKKKGKIFVSWSVIKDTKYMIIILLRVKNIFSNSAIFILYTFLGKCKKCANFESLTGSFMAKFRQA